MICNGGRKTSRSVFLSLDTVAEPGCYMDAHICAHISERMSDQKKQCFRSWICFQACAENPDSLCTQIISLHTRANAGVYILVPYPYLWHCLDVSEIPISWQGSARQSGLPWHPMASHHPSIWGVPFIGHSIPQMPRNWQVVFSFKNSSSVYCHFVTLGVSFSSA